MGCCDSCMRVDEGYQHLPDESPQPQIYAITGMRTDINNASLRGSNSTKSANQNAADSANQTVASADATANESLHSSTGESGINVSSLTTRTKSKAIAAANPYVDDLVSSFYNSPEWKGRVWPTGEYPCTKFPAISRKSNFGIAISGGGLRAASLGLGWLRALSKVQVLTKARYISVNSGASWVTEPLLWASAWTSVEPGLTTMQLDEEYSRILLEICREKVPAALTLNFEGYLAVGVLDNYVPGEEPRNVWTAAVNELFKQVTGNEHPHYRDIAEASPMSSRLPFLIVNGSIVIADGNIVNVAPFEFTPTYCGIPLDPRANISERFANSGGFVHRTVFATNYGDADKDATISDSAGYPAARTYDLGYKFELSEISSISSSAVVEGYFEQYYYKRCGMGDDFVNKNFPVREQYWALNPNLKQLEGGEVCFADGGSTDNTGILALLRRGVTNILALCATLVDVAVADEQTILEGLYDYMGLFNCVTHNLKCIRDIDGYNRQRWVFPKTAWNVLLNSMRQKRSNGEPLVHTFTKLPVLANPCCGVRGNAVDITFVFNGKATKYPGVKWADLGSIIVRAEAIMAPTGIAYPVTSDFPLISTTVLHYSPELVNALAGIAEWSLTEGSGTFLADLAASLD